MGPKRANLQSRDRELEVIDRAGRRREMKNVIDLVFGQKNEIRNVVFDEMKIRVAREMSDVRGVPGHQIIDRGHAVIFRQ